MGLLTVTGAGGFLGRHVVAEALARGHRVRAILRGGGAPPGAEEVRLDLAHATPEAFAGADALILAHGALSGDPAVLARDVVEATAAACRAARAAGVGRAVLAGSVAVYAVGEPGEEVAEESPLGPRDAYGRAKAEEEAVAEGARVLRLGALFGPGRLWCGHLGARVGPVAVRMGEGPIPAAWVAHAAEALVLAAAGAGAGVVNVVDDDLPDAGRWLRALGMPAVPLPWQALDAAAPMLGRLPGAPGLLRRPVLRGRLMPRRWPNGRLHALGWRPRLGFEAAMARAREGRT